MARSIVNEVQEEFGEPFWSVVEGFARDGYSKSATAMFLGYSTASCFLRKLDRFRPDIQFVKGPDSVCFKEARKEQRGRVTDRMKAASLRNSFFIEYKGEVKAFRQHAKDASLSYSCAKQRYDKYPEDLDYVFFSGKYTTRKPF